MPVLAVDVFATIMFGGVAALILALMAIGHFYPGTGAEQLGWGPTRSPELEAQNDVDDLQQMFDAANERRRRKGLRELALADVEQSTRDFQREQAARSAAYAEQRAGAGGDADEEIAQMLERVNARRERRGQLTLTREQYEASLRDA